MPEFINSILSKLGEFASTAGLRLVGALLILAVGFRLCKLFLKLLKKSKAEAEAHAMQRLERVGLADRAGAYPTGNDTASQGKRLMTLQANANLTAEHYHKRA